MILSCSVLVSLLIRYPKSEWRVESECRNVPVEIKKVESMPGITSKPVQTIEMDWLSQAYGQIDCARKLIYLTSPFGEQVRCSPSCKVHVFSLLKQSLLRIFVKFQQWVTSSMSFPKIFRGCLPFANSSASSNRCPIPPRFQRSLLAYLVLPKVMMSSRLPSIVRLKCHISFPIPLGASHNCYFLQLHGLNGHNPFKRLATEGWLRIAS